MLARKKEIAKYSKLDPKLLVVEKQCHLNDIVYSYLY